jgi:capsular polysaccharide biosynthesis protein
MRAYNIQEQADPQNLIYISRRQAGSRRLLNEELLIPELERRGFQILEMEGYSVRDQIDTFSKAKFIVMPHGAAITNMVFASPGATLIEMMPASYQHSFGVIYTTHSRCNYGTIVCDDSANPMTKDISVDIPGLLRAVDKVLEG